MKGSLAAGLKKTLTTVAQLKWLLCINIYLAMAGPLWTKTCFYDWFAPDKHAPS